MLACDEFAPRRSFEVTTGVTRQSCKRLLIQYSDGHNVSKGIFVVVVFKKIYIYLFISWTLTELLQLFKTKFRSVSVDCLLISASAQ